MKREQLRTLLTTWIKECDKSLTDLNKKVKIYRYTHFITMLLAGLISATLLSLSSFIVSENINDGNKRTKLGVSIVLLCLQVVLAFFQLIQNIMNPKKKKDDCKICIKRYDELLRELKVEVEKLAYCDTDLEDNSDYDSDRLAMYDYIALTYSSRRQLIVQDEP